MGRSEMSKETGAQGRSKPARGRHDVATLAQRVSGLDAERYFDAQAQIEYRGALDRWPVLARLMNLAQASPEQHTPAVAETEDERADRMLR